jgi:hypothetical protein
MGIIELKAKRFQCGHIIDDWQIKQSENDPSSRLSSFGAVLALLHCTARVQRSRNFSYRNRVCLIRRGPPRGPHMTYAKPLLMSADAATSSQHYPARMSLSAEQRVRITAAYEKAAADPSLPAHTRAAFAKKADWFRLLAGVEEKKEQAALIASEGKQTNGPGITAEPVLVLGPARPRRRGLAGRFLQGELILRGQSHEYVGDTH